MDLRTLDFEVEGQRKKGRPMRTWKKQVEEENVKIGLRREDALCHWVGANLATIPSWGYYQLLNIGISLFCQ